MKNLRVAEKTYLMEFDVNVNKYLALSEIGVIVENALDYDDLVNRDGFINMAVLRFATDITDEEIDNMDVELAYTSGLVDSVTSCIENYYLINFYINKYEGIEHKLSEFLDEISGLADKMPEIGTLTEELGKLQDVSTKLRPVE